MCVLHLLKTLEILRQRLNSTLEDSNHFILLHLQNPLEFHS